MTDSDNHKDKKPKNEGTNPEDMSLADLLGGDSSADEKDPTGPQRIQERSDEPGSGMVRLSEMVASSNVDQVRTPSAAPPPAKEESEGAVGATPPISTTTTSAPVAEGKSSTGIIMAVIFIAIAAVAAVYYMYQQKTGQENENTRALMAEIEAMKKQQRESGAKASKETESKLEALQEQLKRERALAKAAAKKAAAAKALQETEESTDGEAISDEKDVSDSDKTDDKAKKATATKPRSRSAKDTKTATTKASAKPAKAEVAKKAEEKKKAPTKSTVGGANKLDVLLGGSKDEPKPAAKASATTLPATPGRAAVKAAMAPVVAKAQKCAQYSTGTVNVKMTISSNGRVKTSAVVGSFAGTTAGKCVGMIARTAKFPKFSDPTFVLNYPVTLR